PLAPPPGSTSFPYTTLFRSFALGAAGLTPVRAALLAAATGLMEPLGAILGVGLSSGFAVAYPIGLGLAAGAMIFVVSHEVIPERSEEHTSEFQSRETRGGRL